MSHSSDEKRIIGIYRDYHSAVVGIYGWSKSGKSELMVRIIGELKKNGYGVISAKHTAHEIEHSEAERKKDSARHYLAGAVATLFFNDSEGEIRMSMSGPKEGLKFLAEIPHDIILVEGMKDADWPKIAVGDIESRDNTVLSYPEAPVEEIIRFIEREIKTARNYLLLPGIDCELCGYRCLEMAGLIASGEKTFGDCVVLKKRAENRVRIWIDGKEVDLGKKFMDDLFYNTMTGMVKALKGAGEGDIEIKIRREKSEDN